MEILNLKCGGCANTLKKEILIIEGITDLEVELETSKVNINSKSEFVLQAVKEKLSKMGYPEAVGANTLIHKAKSFVSCAKGRLGEKL